MKAPRRKVAAVGLAAVGMAVLAGVAAADLDGGGVWSPDSSWTAERGLEGPWGKQMVVVGMSPADWDQKMAHLVADNGLSWTPGPPAPAEVDWTREAVVLVALGPMPSVRYEVEVTAVEESKNHLRLIAEVRPLAGGYAAMTSPYHIVKLKRGSWMSQLVRVDYLLVDESGASASLGTSWSGTVDGTPGVVVVSWGSVKGMYR